jgi:hypothetical protein
MWTEGQIRNQLEKWQRELNEDYDPHSSDIDAFKEGCIAGLKMILTDKNNEDKDISRE